MKKILITLSIATVAILGLQSCKDDSKEAKQTQEAKEEVQISEDATVYEVNTKDSKINWLGQTIASKHYGYILFKSGELGVKDEKLESGSFVADMNTIKSEDMEDAEKAAKLDGHLKAEEIFDVQKFPESKFTITSVKASEGEYNTELEGNLEIKGVSKNLELKANVTIEEGKVTLKTEKFTINRQDFNVTYSNGEVADRVIKDDFDMEVIIVADKK